MSDTNQNNNNKDQNLGGDNKQDQNLGGDNKQDQNLGGDKLYTSEEVSEIVKARIKSSKEELAKKELELQNLSTQVEDFSKFKKNIEDEKYAKQFLDSGVKQEHIELFKNSNISLEDAKKQYPSLFPNTNLHTDEDPVIIEENEKLDKQIENNLKFNNKFR